MTSEQSWNRTPIKCIFLGLDYSGKSSILRTLEGEFAQIGAIQPTIRIERKTNFNILGLPIIIWDMGGQEQYMKEYMIRREYFEKTSLLFYVIDIQDPIRFTKSVDYFLDILKSFVMLGLRPHIMVLFHKCDPEIKDQPKILKNIRDLKKIFLELAESIDIGFHNTSIYDYDYLSRVFVQGILKILPKGQVIQDVLNDFMQKTNSNSIMLLDENVLTIAEAYTNEESRNTCRICGPHFATMVENLRKYDLYTPETMEVEMQGWLFFKHIKYLDTGFYLLFYTEVHEKFQTINELLPSFTKDLFNVIKFVL